MQNRWKIVIFALSMSLAQLSAQSFTFDTLARAGRPNGGDWQIGVGRTGQASDSTRNVAWNSSVGTWRADGSQQFEIGWIAATNQAYFTVWNEPGPGGVPRFTTATIFNTGVQLSTAAVWTLPGASFYTSIAGTPANAAEVTLSGLTLSPNTVLLSGALPSDFGVSRPSGGGAQLATLSAPLVIQAAGNGGNWYISGNVRFSGVQGQPTGGLRGSASQFHLQATGSDVPEPSTLAMIGGGLLWLGWRRRKTTVLKTYLVPKE